MMHSLAPQLWEALGDKAISTGVGPQPSQGRPTANTPSGFTVLNVPYCSRARNQGPGPHGSPQQREKYSHTDQSMVACGEGGQGAASPACVDASSWRQGRRRRPNLHRSWGLGGDNPSTLQGAQWNHCRLCSAETWVQTLASRHLLPRDREQDATPPEPQFPGLQNRDNGQGCHGA